MSKIVLRPGDPNDANRDYLPEAIKTSQMVVNENALRTTGMSTCPRATTQPSPRPWCSPSTAGS